METFLAIRELLRLPTGRRKVLCEHPVVRDRRFKRAGLHIGGQTRGQAGHRAAGPAATRAVDVVLDSTGLKMFGEGKWKVRQPARVSAARGGNCTWRSIRRRRKLWPRCLQPTRRTTPIWPRPCWESAGRIDTVTADGIYDKWKVYDAIERRGARPKIPPRHDAKIKRHANAVGPRLVRRGHSHDPPHRPQELEKENWLPLPLARGNRGLPTENNLWTDAQEPNAAKPNH